MRLAAIALLSAALLAYEVLLVRLFAIVQWHHFAYMAISIALLGFGASGTALALAQGRLATRFEPAFAAFAALFGAVGLAGFALAIRVPFNALEVAWDPRQLLHLLALYGLLALPFFFGATAIGLAFIALPDRIGRLYAVNLVGSGLGALGVVLALDVLAPAGALRLVCGLGLAAAALALIGEAEPRRRVAAAVLLGAAIAGPLAFPNSWTALALSEFKGLSQALRVPGAKVVAELSGPLALLTLVESPAIPFRHAPGLSLNATAEPPAQLGLFNDGDSLSAITAFDGRLDRLGYLGDVTSALPYHLLQRPRVLVLGAGGGADVLQALYHGAGRIDAVEMNPQVVRLVGEAYRDFAGRLYERPDVRVHIAEARRFVADADESWDLIQIPLLDSFAAAAAGVHALGETYLYTVEAFRLYLRRLTAGGMLAVTRWLKLPPRDSLKLVATARAALAAEGVGEAGARMMLIRGWNTTTLVVKNGAFTAGEIAALKEFADSRWFDLAYYPGIRAEKTNRRNVLDQPYFYAGAGALLGSGADAFLRRYKFDIAPATDDRPYFFDFFRWRTLPEIVEIRSRGGAALLDWGYLILVATLLQAALLSVVLILLPLRLGSRAGRHHPDRLRIGAYFLALGLAFLFVEIAFIQRFVLYLGHPLFAVAVVLAGLLVFAGAGSAAAPAIETRLAGAARRLLGREAPGAAIAAAGLAIGAVALLYLAVLPSLFGAFAGASDPVRIALALALIAPLGFAMGLPFPLGLRRVAEAVPEMIPWAWGINGCASVLSAVLATILAIHLGFAAVVGLAALLYLGAALLLQRPLVR
ncbi:MAG: SAM-dependent methyltransferase [Proteobacteria bacterium]|nr:SAM-dependent methyltransferase [Pseudomonadota bacterium]